MRPLRVLITGGAGFIGSHLGDRLLADGHEVVVIDNLATGKREDVPAKAKFVSGDVSKVAELEPAFEQHGPIDAVCHIAGQVSLIKSFTDPTLDLRTNVEGTVNVLMQCVKRKVSRVLYASSMTVYGGSDAVRPPEDGPCWPISYYGITKLAGERYAHVTSERSDLTHPLNVTSFRMYNVYGPRQALDNPYQGVLGIFLGNLARGEKVKIFGDGEQSRDFVYVGDVVDAWARALGDERAYGQVFNLGSGKRMSINALADVAARAFDQTKADVVVHEPARPGEQRQVEADTTKIERVLGWRAKTSFEDGFGETVRWARGAKN
ncbi:MAG: SDR family NAD(P)-dependent oxidoreductase [Myxococcales bacterium]|nr:SDR family NAD(P)-dependent oxidoreductase [Myxococcales bacterium]